MQLHCALIVLAVVISESVAQLALLDTLRSSGASKFADAIEADPSASALYRSGKVKTVFAPSDDTPSTRMKRQETPEEQQRQALQASASLNTIADLNKDPGDTVDTQDSSANLGGSPQNVVSDSRNSPSSGVAKRGTSFLRRDDHNVTLPAMFSGLGNNVSIIKGDIPYEGGVIHIVDGPFTLPQSLSSTTRATGHTTFTSLSTASNLTAELDVTAGLTALIPTNAAFATSNVSATSTTTPSLMDGHIIPNFVGYLPSLTNGLKLVTQAGTTVTVTVKGDDFYLNNAKIIASNLILENGVGHVLDQVLSFAPAATPTPTITPFTGAGASARKKGTLQSFIASWDSLLFLVPFGL